jgi:hypothetical protein
MYIYTVSFLVYFPFFLGCRVDFPAAPRYRCVVNLEVHTPPNVSKLLGHRPVDVVHNSIRSSPRWLEQLRHCRVKILVPGGDTAITANEQHPMPTVSIRRAEAFLIVKECAYRTSLTPFPARHASDEAALV